MTEGEAADPYFEPLFRLFSPLTRKGLELAAVSLVCLSVARRLMVFSLLLAWFCANGVTLEVVQCAAWVKMFAGYVPQMSVTAAIDETLDGSKPCAICKSVSKAREHSKSDTEKAQTSPGKLLLAFSSDPRVELKIPPPTWPRWFDEHGRGRSAAVPLPPPRSNG